MEPTGESKVVRIFSFGGGVQSTSVLALQAMGRLPLPYDYFAFANVGNDSENPATLEYVERYTKPFAEAHGIKFVEVQKQRGQGKAKEQDTLVEALYRAKKSIIIPARMGHNGALGNRNCTTDFKIKIVDKFAKMLAPTHVVAGMGISLDEFHRARDVQWHDAYGKLKLGFWKKREYPLIDLRVNRQGCKNVIAEVGLPEPPKSSCFFCPFRKRAEWIQMRREQPELFAKAVAIEQTINAKHTALRKDRLYLHVDLHPLEQAVGLQEPLFTMDEEERCDTGYCWT